MIKKHSKLIVKDDAGKLVEIIPEIYVASTFDVLSTNPASNSALTSALNDAMESLPPEGSLLDVMEEEPTASNTTELDDEALIVWIEPLPSWSITINTELAGAGEKKGQIPFNLYALKEEFQTYASITVNWGDGNTVIYDSANANENKCITYEYASPGIYTITMSGESFNELYIWSKLYGDSDDPWIYTETLTRINSPLPKLAGIYGYLFDGEFTQYIRNTFNSCFHWLTNLQSIPSNLFINNTIATDFAYCFENCSSLQSIPEGLFDNNVEATSFSYCFKNCSSLQSIPEGLFDNNVEATSFYGCFWDCSSLQSIPEELFDKNIAVFQFGWCFRGCSSLNDFILHIGSSSVLYCDDFVIKKSGTTRTIYVPSGSTTQTKFNAVASSLGLTIIGE